MLRASVKTKPQTLIPQTAADVLLNSAVRHGLSLVPMEFVMSGTGPVGDVRPVGAKQGALVLSEFTACSRVRNAPPHDPIVEMPPPMAL